MKSDWTCVDLFAGLGGSSEGAVQAGFRVLKAVNHWPAAVRTHALNHPNTEHSCQDLCQENFFLYPDHDVLIASPACQGHSRARGVDRPHHDATRSTAWAVVASAEAKRPPFLVVENVTDFESWCLYPQWWECLVKLGYTLERTIIDAADLGVPQHRRRLFIVGVHQKISGERVVVPRPRFDHMAASCIIDANAGGWSQVNRPGRATATLARVANGRRQHGHDFLLPYYGAETGGRTLSRPIGTLTTRDRYALVSGDKMRMLTAREQANAQSFPAHYRLSGVRKTDVMLVGNSVPPPCMKWILKAVQTHKWN